MKLADHIRDRGLNAHSFAQVAGVAHTTIGRILAGEVVPGPQTRRKIVEATSGEVTERDLLIGVAEIVGVIKAAAPESRSAAPVGVAA